MRIPFATSSHVRDRGGLPPVDLVNCFVEQTPVTENGVVLQSRKGTTAETTIGSGPIRASRARDGLFGGDRFTVSGTGFYRGTALLGSIGGGGPAYIASSDTEVLVCAGSTLYSYNGTTFAVVTMPFSEGVTAVVHVDGLFVALRAGTGEWWFSNVLDGRTWDGTDFATAESEADQLLDMAVLDGALAFFGVDTVEFWAKTGNSDLPYTPIQQRVFKQGIIATGCVVEEDNSFFWVGADAIVYRQDVVPKAIADDARVEASKASTTHRLFKVLDERHKFICLRLDDQTHSYDLTTGEWCEFRSAGRENWRVGPDMGDDENGTIWEFSGYYDNGGSLVRIFTAGAELSAPVTVNNLRLVAEVGQATDLAGEFAEPVIEMRASGDYGKSWSEWEETSLGAQGEYFTRIEWRSLGMFGAPGVVFQFRVSEPVSFRVTSVGVNEPYGGR